MIKNKLKIVDKKLSLSLEEIRASYNHNGDRGSVSEAVFRDFLREYLPPLNRVGEGEVVDLREQISTQLDVIITNEYHPYLNDLKKPGLFIIEGVACAGEVKTNLNSHDIDVIINSSIRYKMLTPKVQTGASAFGNKSDIHRFIEHRPYFLFAYESQMTITTIHKKLVSYYSANSIPVEHQIDGVFCLNRGAIVNFGDGEGSYVFLTPDKRSLPGLIVTKNKGEEVLLDLMSWLSVSIPKFTLPSSPLSQYLVNQISSQPKLINDE